MRILVGCEFSNTVSQAFRDRGHECYSCDLDPSDGPEEYHYRMDILKAFWRPGLWDLVILHPDCHAMTCSGNGTYGKNKDGTPKPRHQERIDALEWTKRLWHTATERCERVALENPQWSVLWKHLGGRTQTIHPWEYGHRETKATGLKLHNLEPLKPTDIVGPPPPTGTEERKEWERVWRMGPSKHYDRSKERARFLQGWADAMAEQWG